MLQINYGILKGLSNQEAAERSAKFGFNELPKANKRTAFKMVVDVLREPMFFLLLACGFLYFLLGDIHEAFLLLTAIFLVIGITLFQEKKTENALAALKDLSSPQALVIRDGQRKRIPSREVVIGDLVIISEGERVPADGILIQVSSLNIDESMLTGESVSVNKQIDTHKEALARPGGDNSSCVYGGTLVTRGQGLFEVKVVGINTEMGKIGKALESIVSEQSALQKQTKNIVRNFAIIGMGICLFVVVYYSLTRHDWLNGLLAGLTLAMSMMPEEFPVVLTVFLALGAWRISRKKVLTRRIPAVETLGAVTVLCVDKTGTLTKNQMTIQKISVGQEQLLIEESIDKISNKYLALINCALLATPVDPFDPMEKAINELGRKTENNSREQYEFVKNYPLSDKLLVMSNVWQASNNKKIIAAKGSPEAIVDICHLSDKDKKLVELQIEEMASLGLRVIGVARAVADQIGENQHDFIFEYLGLLGFDDPIRPEVPAAIKECRSAGIKVIMITGDYPSTAMRIAQKIGFELKAKIMTGSELESLTAEQLKKKIKNISIFARIVPEQKLMIVEALKANQEIVAMTGDGVNDAPALKAAHIGIAMGKRGSEVAREASDMVLLDDNFASIVGAIKIGRRIYDNMKKAMTFIFSVHIPIAGISLLSVIMNWPLVLFPIHIVFLEMIIDPVCSIVFEMEEAEVDIMKRKPRKLGSQLFSRAVITTGFIQGLSVFAAVGIVFAFALNNGFTENQARALAFFNLVLGNLGLILINRSRNKHFISALKNTNKVLWIIILSACFFLATAIFSSYGRRIFRFDQVLWQELAFSFLLVLGAIVISEVLKLTVIKRLRGS